MITLNKSIANDLGLQIHSKAENQKVAKQNETPPHINDHRSNPQTPQRIPNGQRGPWAYTNSLPSKHKPKWPRGHSLVAVNNSRNGQWMGEKE